MLLASRSPSRSACSGGASARPLGLSVNTGGQALLSIIGVSRVGLDERFILEETRLGARLNAGLSFKASEALLPYCDALCSGQTASFPSIFRRFGLVTGVFIGRDMARLRFEGAECVFESLTSEGGVRGRCAACSEASHELIR